MLIQFRMKNVLSFKDEAVFDMTAVTAYKELKNHLVSLPDDESLVRVAAVYGANASGKTNFYRGMDIFRTIVIDSMNPKDDVKDSTLKQEYLPYSFEKDMQNLEFSIVLSDDGNEYTYGFEYDAERIVSEWLYVKSYRTNRSSAIIEREAADIELGSSVRRECEKYSSQIPDTGLALTFFSRLNLKTDIFRNLFEMIQGMVIVNNDYFEKKDTVTSYLPDVLRDNKNELLKFLKSIDTEIVDVEQGGRKDEFYTTHIGVDGEKYQLNLYNESSGTIRAILIFIAASYVISMNSVMVVDELNVKLHPLLLKYFIDMFYESGVRAQLVYTTHDTTLMDRRYFRRDQIWFVQKDAYGCSELEAMSDYRVRSDASFERSYLAGVFGGIPKLKNFSMKAGVSGGK